mmetsp:Transcript_14936/g.15045  ORF Transcript_14936/g.15045 Transcript_14936/m.15045 type:complete len:212 (+) Transcript_14936:2274-2909(+)
MGGPPNEKPLVPILPATPAEEVVPKLLVDAEGVLRELDTDDAPPKPTDTLPKLAKDAAESPVLAPTPPFPLSAEGRVLSHATHLIAFLSFGTKHTEHFIVSFFLHISHIEPPVLIFDIFSVLTEIRVDNGVVLGIVTDPAGLYGVCCRSAILLLPSLSDTGVVGTDLVEASLGGENTNRIAGVRFITRSSSSWSCISSKSSSDRPAGTLGE